MAFGVSSRLVAVGRVAHRPFTPSYIAFRGQLMYWTLPCAGSPTTVARSAGRPDPRHRCKVFPRPAAAARRGVVSTANVRTQS